MLSSSRERKGKRSVTVKVPGLFGTPAANAQIRYNLKNNEVVSIDYISQSGKSKVIYANEDQQDDQAEARINIREEDLLQCRINNEKTYLTINEHLQKWMKSGSKRVTRAQKKALERELIKQGLSVSSISYNKTDFTKKYDASYFKISLKINGEKFEYKFKQDKQKNIFPVAAAPRRSYNPLYNLTDTFLRGVTLGVFEGAFHNNLLKNKNFCSDLEVLNRRISLQNQSNMNSMEQDIRIRLQNLPNKAFSK